MSFASDVRGELSRVYPRSSCCELAELAAIVSGNGQELGDGSCQRVMQLVTDSAPVARKSYILAKKYFQSVKLELGNKKNSQRRHRYLVRVPSSARLWAALADKGLMAATAGLLPPGLAQRRCCRQAYLRGAFLSVGSVNHPEGDYHLELVTLDTGFARVLDQLLHTFSMIPRVSTRKDYQVVYLKQAEQIVSLFSLIGAHQALLKMENIRVVKDLRNRVNRLVNCETANLTKAVDAGLRQAELIRWFLQQAPQERLPRRLREVAELRLQHPEASLQELGQMLCPQVGKSGVNHRMRKLELWIEEFQKVYELKTQESGIRNQE